MIDVGLHIVEFLNQHLTIKFVVAVTTDPLTY